MTALSWSKLKNIIILILVLLNAFLLVSLGIRGTKEHTARRAQHCGQRDQTEIFRP